MKKSLFLARDFFGIKPLHYAKHEDNFIYEEIAKPQISRSIPCIHMIDTDAIRAFEKWEAKTDKTEY